MTAQEFSGEHHAEVTRSAINALFQNMRDSATVLTLFPLMVVYTLQGDGETEGLWLWLALAELVALGRWWLYFNRKRVMAAERLASWTRLTTISALLSGLLWGSTCLFFFDQASADSIIVINVIVVGLAAGSAVASNYWLPYYLAFTIPDLAIHALYHLSRPGGAEILLALLYLIYLMMLTSLARFMHRTYWENLTLRLNNEELVGELRQEKEVAESAARAKTRFLAAASHDLRQPVHAMALFNEALRNEVNTPRASELSAHIGTSITALNQLLSSLLDISKLDAGVITPEHRTVPLRPLLEELQREAQPLAEEKGVALQLHPCEQSVYSDPTLLGNIVRNLINNAIRYTDRGGVLLRCRRRGGRVEIQVWDSGIGIPADARETIFAEFTQLNNPERDRSKGLGLGLAICRRLAALLGHPLTLHSRPGRGSLFTVTVPLKRSAEQSVEPVQAEGVGDGLAGSAVLVIDDELAVRQGMALLLQQWGCHALLADGIESALATAAGGGAIDAIISDYRLRDNTTGVEAIAAVVRQVGRHIPAMLITGDTSPQRLQEAKRSGYPLLHKPVQPEILRGELARLLAR